MENIVLEKLYNEVADVIQETFTRKYYFVKDIIVKKRTYLFDSEEEKGKIFYVSNSVFNWCREKNKFKSI